MGTNGGFGIIYAYGLMRKPSPTGSKCVSPACDWLIFGHQNVDHGLQKGFPDKMNRRCRRTKSFDVFLSHAFSGFCFLQEDYHVLVDSKVGTGQKFTFPYIDLLEQHYD